MLKIRLMRIGKRNRPFYRIVVQNLRQKVDGASLAVLGTYDPVKGGKTSVDVEKFKSWVARGAKASPVVSSIIRKAAKKGTA